MSRGKHYTQEEKDEIYRAYKEGMTIQQIAKYVAKGRPSKGIRTVIKETEEELMKEITTSKEGTSFTQNVPYVNSEVLEELKRMNDLKLKELDLMNSIWISLRNIAVNTKNLADELGKDGD